MSEFRNRLKQIKDNSEQFDALTREKSSVVIAGPGSGKTFLLTMKVAKLLNEDVFSPYQVACLTYSRLLVRQIKYQLKELGALQDNRLFIGTVHSFCLGNIIKPYAHLFDEINLPNPMRFASKDEQLDAVDKALTDLGFNTSRLFSGGYGRDLESMGSYLDSYRRLHIDYDIPNYSDRRWSNINFSHHFSRILGDIDWSKFAQCYVRNLRDQESSSIDFTELEVLSAKLVRDKKFIQQILLSCFPWLVIDEYQDLGLPFHTMVSTLIDKTNINVFAIGDPDQCIYEELQATNPEYIIQLSKLVELRDNSQPIMLKRNYRCAKNFIKISEFIIGGERDYQSTIPGGKCICIKCLGNFKNQISLIHERILPHLLEDPQGPKLAQSDIAIFDLRRGRGINVVSHSLETLSQNNFTFVIDKDPDFDNATGLISWLELVAAWCIYGWRTGQPKLEDIVSTWSDLVTNYYGESSTVGYIELKYKLFFHLWHLRVKESDNFISWIKLLRERLNLDGLVNGHKYISPDEAEEYWKLIKKIDESENVKGWSISKFARVQNAIQLTTMYSGKGQQFEAVIITNADRLNFSNTNTRRVAYVGVTRAKRLTYLLYTNPNSDLIRILQESKPPGVEFFKAWKQKNVWNATREY